MSWGLFVPVAVLAIAIAAVRAAGVLIVKPPKARRVYTKPVISGSWGQQQQAQMQGQADFSSREPHA